MNRILYNGLIVAVLLVIALLPAVGLSDFDREACYTKCRRTLPGWAMLSDSGTPDYLAQGAAYDNCMQECDRQFWKDFDQRIKDLEKSREYDRSFRD